MRRRVVVTGIGAVSPLGIGAQTLFESWTAGKSGIVDGLARCDDFVGVDHLGKKEARRTDRFTQMAIIAADEAVDMATEGTRTFPDPDRVACIIGTGAGGMTTVESSREVYDKTPREPGAVRRKVGVVSPLTVPKMMANAPAGFMSIRYGARGPAFAVVSACAAGTDAIGVALRLVRSGEADVVITGGAESSLTEFSIDSFAAMEATSKTGVSRPFDKRRDGFILGEGAAVLVLESAEHAAARGATVIGELLGHGASSDAHHLVAPDPAGSGAALAMTRALADAGVEAGHVDYVNAHGTSTPLNDRAETVAINLALGERAGQIPVSSTKSAIGHLLGAAGAVEAVATLMALTERVAPPTLNWGEAEEGLDLDYVPDLGRTIPESTNGRSGMPAVALSNSFGFGGHNSVLCLAGAPA